MTPTTPTPAAAPDLWHHYGASAAPGRPALTRLYWDWYQRTGPGEELLGDIAGRYVAELGAGSAHQAAYVARVMTPARVIALDSSAAQHARSRALHGDVPHLDLVQADAARYLTEHPSTLDVAYSLFGAVDFRDPQTLLPAVAVALRPGGHLVFSTLGHYKNGTPPATECQPANVPTHLADGSLGTMQRWVLDMPVWEKLLTEFGFELLDCDAIRDPGPEGAAPVTTTIFRARSSRP
ncbi:class I SAM-dependent methyltransferase [Streptomyces sp. NPDC060022]|uniref:class I SAM-dependent methyltransferase n=1 Tax=Streptomyces sp. NPDC060022 TaxID=3347039 RepID=UPI00369B8986